MTDHDSKPVELSEAQIDALADAGNRALNDHYHEHLCACSAWPESCVSSGNYFAGSWDTAAFSIGMAAVIGLWESMGATVEAELSQLRARVAELEALTPAAIQTCRVCGAGYDLGQPCSVCEFKAQMTAAIADRSGRDTPEAPRG